MTYAQVAKDGDRREQEQSERRKARQETEKKTEPDKSNKRAIPNLAVGSIFFGTHCEWAGDRSNHSTTRGAPSTDGITRCASHPPIIIKDRKFIVLSKHFHHYHCIPLYTYQTQGAIGRSDEADHVSVFDHRRNQLTPAQLESLNQEPSVQQSHWKPLHTHGMRKSAYYLSPYAVARLTYPVSWPKNIEVEHLGFLDGESFQRLNELYRLFHHGVPDGDERIRLEAKLKDPNWTGEAPPPMPEEDPFEPDSPTTPGFSPSRPRSPNPPPATRAPRRDRASFTLSGPRPFKTTDWADLGKKRHAAVPVEESEASKTPAQEDDGESKESDKNTSQDTSQDISDASPDVWGNDPWNSSESRAGSSETLPSLQDYIAQGSSQGEHKEED
jgi:hypothetical protein